MTALDIIEATVLDVEEYTGPRLQAVPSLVEGTAAPADASPAWYAARSRTDHAKQAIHTANAWAEVAADLIKRAWDCRDDVVLGYDTWAAYVEVEFAGVRDLKLPEAGLRQIVAALDTAGLSGRAGAAPLGISEGTWRLTLAALERTGYVPRRKQLAAEASLQLVKKGAVARTRVQRLRDLLHEAGPAGLTAKELRKKMRDVPDPGAILSELHTRHVIARLAQHEESGTRDGFAVYVDHEHVGMRDVEAPGRRSRRVLPS